MRKIEALKRIADLACRVDGKKFSAFHKSAQPPPVGYYKKLLLEIRDASLQAIEDHEKESHT